MRDAFVRALVALAMEREEIELLAGDLGFGVLKPYFEAVPDRFLDVGIAEQNMTAMAAGMALIGKTVFTYSIGNFPTLRCLEQIRNDCAYPGADVKIVCVGGGFVYGSLGMSHHATEDIACMRALPGVVVVCPGDPAEAEAAVRAVADRPGTAYLRLGRGGEPRIHGRLEDFRLGRAIPVHAAGRSDRRIALFSTGAILDEAVGACRLLELAGVGVEQYSFPTVKPLDAEAVLACARTCPRIVTLEEHSVVGGFGGAVAEVLADAGAPARLIRLGLDDEYCALVGDRKYLRSRFGLDAASVARRVLEDLS